MATMFPMSHCSKVRDDLRIIDYRNLFGLPGSALGIFGVLEQNVGQP